MPKYVVCANITISAFTYVEAADPIEAATLAENERSAPGLCHQCGGDPNTEFCLSDGIDGEPMITVVEPR